MADTSTISLRKSGDQTRGVPQFNVVPIDELFSRFHRGGIVWLLK
jgi:hypothetical protein